MSAASSFTDCTALPFFVTQGVSAALKAFRETRSRHGRRTEKRVDDGGGHATVAEPGGRSAGDTDGAANGHSSQGDDYRESIAQQALPLVRYAGVVAALRAHDALHAAAARVPRAPAALAVGATAGWFAPPFTWSFAMYLILRKASMVVTKATRSSGAASSGATPPHLEMAGVTAIAVVHNWLMTHRADWVSSSYLKVWLSCLPHYHSPAGYRRHFSERRWRERAASGLPADAGASDPRCYAPEQVSDARLAGLPKLFATMVKMQIPFVSALYLLPVFLFWRKTASRLGRVGVVGVFGPLLWRTLRSAVVLASLPLFLLEFPAVYRSVTRSEASATARAPFLHAVSTGVASAAAFMLEPPARRETLVVYTAWRIVESVVRRRLLLHFGDSQRAERHGVHGGSASHTTTERQLQLVMTGLAVAACSAP